jgi:protein-S-isoprenylcysteine O-methyltransferase Ste14
MNPRLLRVLLALYPREFRRRYGSELSALTRELLGTGDTSPARAGLNLAAGAAVERSRAFARSGGLLAVTTVVAAGAAIVLAVSHAHRLGVVVPYFDRHAAAGFVALAVVMCWLLAEFIQFLRVQEARVSWDDATRVRLRSRGLAFVCCNLTANLWLYLAPPIFPAAAIRPGTVAFAVGMVLFAVGVVLRVWSFKELGRSFSYRIVVSRSQPVVSSGPYRLIRHPSYAGALLLCVGIGVASANWAGAAAMTVLPLIAFTWMIRIEEKALLDTLAGRYRCYASQHKRLVPLVW